MKKIFLVALSTLMLSGGHLLAQCVPNGISTNPSSPVNPQLPAKTNLHFDWRQTTWQNNSSCQLNTLVESPFYKIDNIEVLRASKDMLPEDGWELIRREFGYTDQHTVKVEVPEHTYFILYNKYTGILRVLLKTCRGVDYNGVKITLRFDATTTFQTALLDFTSSTRALNETHSKNPAAQSVSVFVNDKTKWFYADFPMTYDPCSCKYKSKINIISELIQQSTISLQGAITGTLTSITNGQGNVNSSGSYSFKDFANDAGQFKKVYSGVDNFITETRNVVNTIPNSQTATNISNGLTSLQTGLKSLNFLKTGLAAVPWIQAASSLLDLFIGGGKTGPQQVQVMPMAANLSLKVSGTMSTSNQYHNIIFSNPGSLDAQNDPDIYPFYNETMGVFNLLNGPVFSRNMYVRREGSHREGFKLVSHLLFRLKEPVKWVLNPASDLQLQDGQVAFVVASPYNNATPPDSYREGFNTLEGKNEATQTWQYRTAYVDLNCLGTGNLFHFTQGDGNLFPKKFYLKLILNFSRISNPAAQNVLVVLTYPIMNEATTTALTGTDFSTACVGGAIQQATATETSSFCNSTAYTANRTNRISYAPTPVFTTAAVPAAISLYPNPVTDKLTLQTGNSSRQLRSIQIFNAANQQVLSRIIGSVISSYDINLSAVPGGVYLLKAAYTDGTTESHKFIVLKK